MDRILAVDQKPTLIETIRTKLHKRNNVDIANYDANWNQLTAPRGCSLIDFTISSITSLLFSRKLNYPLRIREYIHSTN